ncbi:phosphoribosylglycinamide formyltransferase [candidate division CSSED10-310 bacterium]|uniref:Phosphoribosylglycinamide formyltransferase n=1 Tax=candidate division CSSED10-310 bacterium TaxID=2855610 RepID=A0ABV6YRG4_UNCC1
MSEEYPYRIAVLLSGGGTNLQAIIDSIELGKLPVSLAFVASNKAKAYGLERARKHAIPAYHISAKTHGSQHGAEQEIYRLIQEHQVHLLCLAGYLKKLSPFLITKMRHRIINIHPGILPFLGGKGLYGHHVHQRVIELGMKISGVTIHLVDEEYDHGPIIAQEGVAVADNDDADSLAERVLKVEHKLYPQVINYFAQGKIRLEARRIYIDD